jgi:hypothetical protein
MEKEKRIIKLDASAIFPFYFDMHLLDDKLPLYLEKALLNLRLRDEVRQIEWVCVRFFFNF